MNTLNFDVLRDANIERCEAVYHPLADWSLTDWATAAAGELGEACGVVKDLRRLEDGVGWVKTTDDVRLRVALGEEIADTVIYLDLLAARAGIDLGEAIRRKFNLTSDKVGSAVKL